MLAHVCNGQKPSCSHFFSMALQQSYRECAGHIRDIVLFIRDVGLSPVVPNEHARLVFQHATSVFVKSLHLLVVPGLPCAHVLVARENVRLPVIKVQKLLNLLAN